MRNRPSSRTPSNSRPARLAGYRRYHPGTQPEYNFPPYASTLKRCPTQPLVLLPQTLSEITGPVFGTDDIKPTDSDLTRQHEGEPIGERIVVTGRVLDENGRPVPHTLVEVWQANAAGRYPHSATSTTRRSTRISPAPAARSPTPRDAIASSPSGRASIPGATTTTPGGRRTSISRCSGRRSSRGSSRRCTFRAIRCCPTTRCSPASPTKARASGWSSAFDWENTIPEQALGYRFDIVLRGRDETPMEKMP